MELCLFLLEGGDLILELHVLDFLVGEVPLQFVFHAAGLALEVGPDFVALVTQYILELLLLLSEHLHFALGVLEVLLDGANHFLRTRGEAGGGALTSKRVRVVLMLALPLLVDFWNYEAIFNNGEARSKLSLYKRV